MKNLALLFALGGLMSAAPVYADLIEDGIKENNDLLVIAALNARDAKLTHAQKEAYLQKAQLEVEKHLAKQGSVLTATTELDLLGITASVLATFLGAVQLRATLFSKIAPEAAEIQLQAPRVEKDNDKYWLGSLGGFVAFLGGTVSTIKGIQDFRKHLSDRHAKNKKALSGAQNIVKIIQLARAA